MFGPGLDAFYREQQRIWLHNLFSTGSLISQALISRDIRLAHRIGFECPLLSALDKTEPDSETEEEAERINNSEKLIEWILSPQGQRLVEKVGYVPLFDG